MISVRPRVPARVQSRSTTGAPDTGEEDYSTGAPDTGEEDYYDETPHSTGAPDTGEEDYYDETPLPDMITTSLDPLSGKTVSGEFERRLTCSHK